MQGIEIKQVVFSNQYFLDTEEIFSYGVLTFGLNQAQKYESLIDAITSELATCYQMYPECRFLATKGKIYRWIILDAHSVIYRITPERIEVLRVISSRMSITAIKRTRRIKID